MRNPKIQTTLKKIVLSRPNSCSPMGLLMYGLTGLSHGYRWVIESRNRMMRRYPPERFGAVLVSVGNLSVGGTGKTPVVAWLANTIQEEIPMVGIVLRGYGRRLPLRSPVCVGVDFPLERELDYTGDEAKLLASMCPQVPVMVCADRVVAIDRLVREFNVRVVILDDGFQQTGLPKALDIVCLDSHKPLGNGYLIPRGILREAPVALNRATHFLFPKGKPADRMRKLTEEASHCSIHEEGYCDYRISGLYSLSDSLDMTSMDQLQGKKILVISGIGNPDALKTMIDENNLQASFLEYADHYTFNPHDLRFIKKRIEDENIEVLLTTEKDAVRMQSFTFPIPCYVLEMEIFPSEYFKNEISNFIKSLQSSGISQSTSA